MQEDGTYVAFMKRIREVSLPTRVDTSALPTCTREDEAHIRERVVRLPTRVDTSAVPT